MSVIKVLDSFVYDHEWQIIVGKETILIVQQNEIKESVILGDSTLQPLHSIEVNPSGNYILPGRYSSWTDSVYF